MNLGFIPSVQAPDHWLFGSEKIDQRPLNEKGDWERWLPKKEIQHQHGFDTQACTSFGTLNALEILFYRKYGKRENFSERYSAIRTGTTPRGNDPHKVIEQIRKYVGTIPERDMPFPRKADDWNEYYTPVPFSLRLKGARWVSEWAVEHEWVFPGNAPLEEKQSRLINALKFSPIGISVNAWNYRNGLYYKEGLDNHWCVLISGRENRYWTVFDSYDRTIKRLDWNYDFGQAKRYSITYRSSLPLKAAARLTAGIIL